MNQASLFTDMNTAPEFTFTGYPLGAMTVTAIKPANESVVKSLEVERPVNASATASGELTLIDGSTLVFASEKTTAHLVHVDRATAARMLTVNISNRAMRENAVRELRYILRNSEWMVNGETLVFSREGILMNGQHRLQAVVDTGVPITIIVIRGIDLKAFHTLDGGLKRSPADVMSIDGHKHYRHLAAAVTANFVHRKYGDPTLSGKHRQPIREELLKEVETYPELISSTNFIMDNCKWVKTYMPPRAAIFCHFKFAQKHPAKADEFFTLLNTGSGLSITSPIHLLRERMILERNKKRGSIGKLENSHLIAYVFRAFSLFLEGRDCKILKIANLYSQEVRDLLIIP